MLEKNNAYYYDSTTGTSHIDPSKGEVVNPTSCVWDINDHFEYQVSSGYLNPGASSSRSDCLMAGIEPMPVCYSIGAPGGDGCYYWSGNDHWYGYSVVSSAATLHTEVCFSPEARCFADDSAVWNATWRLWEYDFCVQPVYSPSDAALTVIPGSLLDGVGNGTDVIPYGSFPYTRQETITLKVTNTGARQVKQVGALFGISSDIFFPFGCVPYGWTIGDLTPNSSSVPKQSDYPFRWITTG